MPAFSLDAPWKSLDIGDFQVSGRTFLLLFLIELTLQKVPPPNPSSPHSAASAVPWLSF